MDMQSNQRASYIVGLALFLALLAAACGAEPTSTPTPTVLPTPIATQTPLQELVGRFFGMAIGLKEGQHAQVILGSLPSDFNLPLPEGTIVVGSVASNIRPQQLRHIFLDVPLEPQETLEFFREPMAPLGQPARKLTSYEAGRRLWYCPQACVPPPASHSRCFQAGPVLPRCSS